MILTPKEMAKAEQELLSEEQDAEPLMEDAGKQIAAAIRQFFGNPGTLVAFVGNGHNGGDALVAARHLKKSGWDIRLHLAGSTGSLKALTAKKLEELGHDTQRWEKKKIAQAGRPLVLLDGILGGARALLLGEDRDFWAEDVDPGLAIPVVSCDDNKRPGGDPRCLPTGEQGEATHQQS